MRPFRSALAALTLAAALAAPAAALTLYDPGLGTLPSAQGWSTGGSGTALGTQSILGGLLAMDTTGSGVGAFGNGRFAPQPLDTGAGFTLTWQLQVTSESHTSNNRAGFSVLVQGQDQTRSLELGFWADRVWALEYVIGSDDSGYVQGAGASLDTTSTLRTFALTVQGDQFSLLADGSSLLGGAMRDYPTDLFSTPATIVYAQSSYLFFGDNSARGTSTASVGAIELLPVPEPTTALLLAAGLVVVLRWARRRS